MSAILQVIELERLARWNGNVGQNDSRAASLRSTRRRGTVGARESARVGPLLNVRRVGWRRDHRRDWAALNSSLPKRQREGECGGNGRHFCVESSMKDDVGRKVVEIEVAGVGLLRSIRLLIYLRCSHFTL